MNADTILLIIIVIVSIDFVLEQILDYLNIKSQKEDLPEDLKGIYNEEKYQQSLSYNKANVKFSFITSSISFCLYIFLIVTGTFGYLDILVRDYVVDPIMIAIIFYGVLFICSDLLNLPFQLYKTFSIEERYGFNKTTYSTFFSDKLKGYLLTIILGGGILWILHYLIVMLGPDFWIYFWLIIAVFMVVINMFYTSLIVPLFNKLTPLEDGELKDAIERYSHQIKFPVNKIFVINGSKRSSKANAFFSGIGKKKKIVLYDTLINNHTTEELVAVLAHEVGHYKKKHIVSGMILSVLQIGLMLFIMSKMIFNEQLSLALGGQQLAIHLNLLAFVILYSPISRITGLFMNVFSRKNEFEADAFATHTYNGEALKVALKKLSVDNLSNLLPHDLYVFFNYSHPPLLQRIRAIDLVQKEGE